MRFDTKTGNLIDDSSKRNPNSFSLWRREQGENILLTIVLIPFRMVFIIIKIIWNSGLFIFKNFSAILLKVVIHIVYLFLLFPFKIVIFILSIGKVKLFQDWLQSASMKIDFWKNRGFIN